MTSIDYDYFRTLTPDAQDEIRNWLRSIGGDPDQTVAFEVHADYVLATVYALDANGSRWAISETEAAKESVRLPLTEQPPAAVSDTPPPKED